MTGLLDNSVGKSDPDNVSMALGWDFALQQGETGILSFLLGTQRPLGFHLRHFDPNSGESVYFSSALDISLIPESSAGVSMAALTAVALVARWRKVSRR